MPLLLRVRHDKPNTSYSFGVIKVLEVLDLSFESIEHTLV